MRPPQTAHHANNPPPPLPGPRQNKWHCLLSSLLHFHETDHRANTDNLLSIQELQAKHRERNSASTPLPPTRSPTFGVDSACPPPRDGVPDHPDGAHPGAAAAWSPKAPAGIHWLDSCRGLGTVRVFGVLRRAKGGGYAQDEDSQRDQAPDAADRRRQSSLQTVIYRSPDERQERQTGAAGSQAELPFRRRGQAASPGPGGLDSRFRRPQENATCHEQEQEQPVTAARSVC